MLNVSRILVSARFARVVLAVIGVAGVAACGQKGILFLPTGAAAAGRATLTETLSPSYPSAVPPAAAASAATPPGTGTASPIKTP